MTEIRLSALWLMARCARLDRRPGTATFGIYRRRPVRHTRAQVIWYIARRGSEVRYSSVVE